MAKVFIKINKNQPKSNKTFIMNFIELYVWLKFASYENSFHPYFIIFCNFSFLAKRERFNERDRFHFAKQMGFGCIGFG